MESTRIDRWLWAVRLTKTRPDAAAACRGGHVRINDKPAKASATVVPGDQVRYEVEVVHRQPRYAKLAGRVLVGETVAADAVITSAMVDR